MSELTLTLVTPSFNRLTYLEDTIQSVLGQDFPDLQYIIIDGGSEDKSVELIKKYSNEIFYWESEPDQGQYHAINKGFQKGLGDIMGWLNSDDILLPGALNAVARIFSDCPEIEWVTGLSSNIDKDGFLYQAKIQYRYTKESFLMGPVRGIQQESTFWRRSLWDKAGGSLDESYKLAADYELWCRFFEHARLYHVNLPLGAFRRHGNQTTQHKREQYLKELHTIQKNYRSKLSPFQKVYGLVKALIEQKIMKKFIYQNTISYKFRKHRYIKSLI